MQKRQQFHAVSFEPESPLPSRSAIARTVLALTTFDAPVAYQNCVNMVAYYTYTRVPVQGKCTELVILSRTSRASLHLQPTSDRPNLRRGFLRNRDAKLLAILDNLVAHRGRDPSSSWSKPISKTADPPHNGE